MNKKVILWIVFCFLLIVLTVGLLGYYLVSKGIQLDKESKDYVDTVVPNVISGWNKEELLKQASPELLGVTKDEDLDKLFTMFRKLGKLKKYKGSEGQSLISVTTEQGKKVTANYTAMAEFERGEASIKVNLIKHGDEWQILMFNVSSDIFLNL
ncbi:MAG: hypothetical protein ACYTE1_07520 [Planctomycetota bacterium]|jgi:hypothetical protein